MVQELFDEVHAQNESLRAFKGKEDPDKKRKRIRRKDSIGFMKGTMENKFTPWGFVVAPTADAVSHVQE